MFLSRIDKPAFLVSQCAKGDGRGAIRGLNFNSLKRAYLKLRM